LQRDGHGIKKKQRRKDQSAILDVKDEGGEEARDGTFERTWAKAKKRPDPKYIEKGAHSGKRRNIYLRELSSEKKTKTGGKNVGAEWSKDWGGEKREVLIINCRNKVRRA